MFLLVKKLLANFDLRKQSTLVQLLEGTWLFMLPRLLQVNAFAGTIESDFALFAAALGTDASMDGRAKAFFFAFVADCASQNQVPGVHYGTRSTRAT
jgi:hypothetical protein